jgi:hypothetical protein
MELELPVYTRSKCHSEEDISDEIDKLNDLKFAYADNSFMDEYLSIIIEKYMASEIFDEADDEDDIRLISPKDFINEKSFPNGELLENLFNEYSNINKAYDGNKVKFAKDIKDLIIVKFVGKVRHYFKK